MLLIKRLSRVRTHKFVYILVPLCCVRNSLANVCREIIFCTIYSLFYSTAGGKSPHHLFISLFILRCLLPINAPIYSLYMAPKCGISFLHRSETPACSPHVRHCIELTCLTVQLCLPNAFRTNFVFWRSKVTFD